MKKILTLFSALSLLFSAKSFAEMAQQNNKENLSDQFMCRTSEDDGLPSLKASLLDDCDIVTARRSVDFE